MTDSTPQDGALTTQPNEDEYHVSVIPLSTAQASGNLFILLDGHAGPHTSAHARTHLPPIITSKLQELPATAWTERSSDDAVAQCLTRSILEYDKSLEQAFIAALPSTDQLAGMSQTAVEAIFDDPERLIALQRYVCGSTALVVLQVGKDIWTATVGDCEAILGHKEDDGSWGMIPLHGGPHNTRVNPKEKDIVSEGHPGEEVIVKNRVLDSIAVTRGEITPYIQQSQVSLAHDQHSEMGHSSYPSCTSKRSFSICLYGRKRRSRHFFKCIRLRRIFPQKPIRGIIEYQTARHSFSSLPMASRIRNIQIRAKTLRRNHGQRLSDKCWMRERSLILRRGFYVDCGGMAKMVCIALPLFLALTTPKGIIRMTLRC